MMTLVTMIETQSGKSSFCGHCSTTIFLDPEQWDPF